MTAPLDFPILDLVGHLGYAAMFAGMILIGRGQVQKGLARIGWPLRLAGESAWVAIGIVLVSEGVALWSIIIWGVVFCLADVAGWTASISAHKRGR